MFLDKRVIIDGLESKINFLYTQTLRFLSMSDDLYYYLRKFLQQVSKKLLIYEDLFYPSKIRFGKIFEDQLIRSQQDTGSDFLRQLESGQFRDIQIAVNHYQAGLVYVGMGQKNIAKTEITKALELDPGQVWSKIHLESLNK